MSTETMHNYIKKLESMLKAGQIARNQFSFAEVYHDNWCGINSNRECNCDPDIKVVPMVVVETVDSD